MPFFGTKAMGCLWPHTVCTYWHRSVVHYVCMLVRRFEPQGRRFTNFHYYYYYYLATWAVCGRLHVPSNQINFSTRWFLIPNQKSLWASLTGYNLMPVELAPQWWTVFTCTCLTKHIKKKDYNPRAKHASHNVSVSYTNNNNKNWPYTCCMFFFYISHRSDQVSKQT